MDQYSNAPSPLNANFFGDRDQRAEIFFGTPEIARRFRLQGVRGLVRRESLQKLPVSAKRSATHFHRTPIGIIPEYERTSPTVTGTFERPAVTR